MTKPILIIDPGHGGKDPGGGSSIFNDPNGFYEKDMVLNISLYQYDLFKELGVPVAITRSTDVTLESGSRTKLVRESGAKHCISNHVNAASNVAARGIETIHSIFSNSKLATALLDAVVYEAMPKRRVFSREGTKQIKGADGTVRVVPNGSDYYFMHRETGAVETVIVEYGFATNTADSMLLKENWKRYAEAVVKAYCQFIGHAYTPPKGVENVEAKKKTDFTDVPAGHWAEKSIAKAATAGVITGVAPRLFGLGQPVTREQLAVILDRLGLLEVK